MKLPKLYKNENITQTHNKTYCYIKNTNEKLDDKLNKIFNGLGHSYNIPVIIKTKDKEYNTSLISRTNNRLITIDNDVIKIDDILYLDIKRD